MAQRSLCTGAKVGCVIVSPDNQGLASSYNGPPAGFRHDDLPCAGNWCVRASLSPEHRDASYADCPALHAEANAISASDRHTREGGTIYITSHVCWNCAKLIANSGIRRVVVKSASLDAYRRPARSYDFLISLGIQVDARTEPSGS